MNNRWKTLHCPVALIALLAIGGGCLEHGGGIESGRISAYEARNLGQRQDGSTSGGSLQEQLERMKDPTPPEPVKLEGFTFDDPEMLKDEPTDPRVVFVEELPDPEDAETVYQSRLPELTESVLFDYRDHIYPDAVKYVKEIRRTKRVRLSLEECLRRTLANNYQIRVEGYRPAIAAAQMVQAEAAFDAAFFASISRENRDQPVASQLQSGESLTNAYAAGIRQRLPTGAELTLTQALGRNDIPGFQFTTLNPAYTTNFIAELRQPLLRNFGIDFNRSQIEISRNNRESSVEAFRRQVITTLNDTERAYWDLVSARRQVVITAELLAQSKRTLEGIRERNILDSFATLIANSEAQFKNNSVQYIAVKRLVFDAEDQLRNLMNDPELNLYDDIEIIPTEQPVLAPVARNMYREVEVALDRRPEIREARLAISNARINVGVAKNQALPTLDFVLRHTINGLGANADNSFDQQTTYNFADTLVSLEFAWNFGERAERAGIRIAALQHSQAVATFKQAIDGVITDCRVTLRDLNVSHEQISPASDAVDASQTNLRSILERAEDRSPERLNSIFSAQSQVAQSRQSMLQAIVNYNKAIVNLERAKGTLLEYDNIVLAEQPQ